MSIPKEIKEQYLQIKGEDNGSSYYNVDLHIHTPGSFDYTIDEIPFKKILVKQLCQYAIKNNYLKDNFIKDTTLEKEEIAALIIVKQALKVGLNLVVVIDHNTIHWYDKIKQAVDALNPINFSALPGAEITCYGGEHVIVIFNPDDYIDKWNNLKEEIEFKIEEGRDDIATNKSIPDVKAIKNNGGITYLPHLDHKNFKKKITCVW